MTKATQNEINNRRLTPFGCCFFINYRRFFLNSMHKKTKKENRKSRIAKKSKDFIKPLFFFKLICYNK